MPKFTLVVILFLFFTTIIKAQEIATFKIFESQLFESKITIVYETGQNTVIPLEKLSLISSSKEEMLKIEIKNQKIITKELNKMKKKGYSISKISMSGENHRTTFIIFTKE